MYSVSQAFHEQSNNISRDYHWSGEVRSRNGAVYPFTDNDIVKGSGYINRQLCSGSEIEIGTVYAAELGITLLMTPDRYSLEGGEVEVNYSLTLADGTAETIPMGVYDIVEANRGYKTLELKAYDHMLRFDESLRLTSSSGYAYDFLAMACEACGVEMAFTQKEVEAMPNGTELLGVYSDNDMESWRDLLHYVSQAIGRICQIDRSGKLALVELKMVSNIEIPWQRRYSSTYSDFVTRYTALSSTNQMTQTAEYRHIEPDDGLTMNLQSNPFLQYGVEETRERMLQAVLVPITAFRYVPFDAEFTGDLSLDPGDIVTFTGGHADPNEVSCITEIDCKMFGKVTIKCVGKNPRQSAAKSKNDKNLTGLLNQMDGDKTVVYEYINAEDIDVADGGSEQQVVNIEFASQEKATAFFLGQAWVTATETSDGTPVTVTVRYYLNDELFNNFTPKETCEAGEHSLTLFIPISNIPPNKYNKLLVTFTTSGGDIHIDMGHVRAMVNGQGLASNAGAWDGLIDVSDMLEVKDITVTGPTVFRGATDSQIITFYDPQRNVLGDTFGALSVQGTFTINGILTDTVEEIEVLIASATMDKEHSAFPYDRRYVTCSDDGRYSLVDKDGFDSHNIPIDRGWLEQLTIDTTPYASVTAIEVRADRNTAWDIGTVTIDSTSNAPTHGSMAECADGVYKLRHDYTQDSITGTIDSGWLEEVT